MLFDSSFWIGDFKINEQEVTLYSYKLNICKFTDGTKLRAVSCSPTQGTSAARKLYDHIGETISKRRMR